MISIDLSSGSTKDLVGDMNTPISFPVVPISSAR